jgi:HK97 family phage prohead protease
MLEKRRFETELRLIDGARPVIEGHAAVFNQRSHDMGFREVIMPGAFTEAVSNDDVKFLLNHDGLPLARTKSGSLKLWEDAKGLAFHTELDASDPDVQRLLPKIKRGDVNEMSFQFSISNHQTDEKWSRDGQEIVRSILKARLFDVSAVTFPAYPGTDLQSRSYFEGQISTFGTVPPVKLASEVQQARAEFIARRIPPADPLSIEEILKRARK